MLYISLSPISFQTKQEKFNISLQTLSLQLLSLLFHPYQCVTIYFNFFLSFRFNFLSSSAIATSQKFLPSCSHIQQSILYQKQTTTIQIRKSLASENMFRTNFVLWPQSCKEQKRFKSELHKKGLNNTKQNLTTEANVDDTLLIQTQIKN